MSSQGEDNFEWHWPFLYGELAKFVKRDPLATRFRRRIARETIGAINIDLAMGKSDHRFTDVAEFLFYWIENDGGLESDWLQADDGEWLDDNGDTYADAIPEKIEGCSQLAALGLHLIEDEINSHDSAPFVMLGMNDHGFKEIEIVHHKAECLMLAYKCLVYAQRLQLGTALSEAETENSKSINFTELRKKFATERAKNAAAAKLANDKSQTEKTFVYGCWQEWQSGKTIYKGKAAFARDMLEKCENLTNQNVIEGWCRMWEKKHASS